MQWHNMFLNYRHCGQVKYEHPPDHQLPPAMECQVLEWRMWYQQHQEPHPGFLQLQDRQNQECESHCQLQVWPFLPGSWQQLPPLRMPFPVEADFFYPDLVRIEKE